MASRTVVDVACVGRQSRDCHRRGGKPPRTKTVEHLQAVSAAGGEGP